MEERKYNAETPKTPFQSRVEEVINSLSLDNASNTPDFMLGKFVDTVFWAANKLIQERDWWYGVDLQPGKQIMTLSSFIENFSHNNEIYIENRKSYAMTYKYTDDDKKHLGPIMDWELKFTDIADINVIRISNVIRPKQDQGITIVIDTDLEEFHIVPEKVKEDNCPLWLYNTVHKCNKMGCEACG